MRPLETVLLLTDLVAVLAVLVPRLRATLWTRLFTALAALMAIAQLLLEGPRWQLLPAYSLTATITFVWLRRTFARKRALRDQTRRRPIVNAATIGLGALWLAVAAGLPVVLPVFRFAQPTGPHAIGTVTYHWVDSSRAEVLAADPTQRRQLMVQIWYPAPAGASAIRASYIPDGDLVTAAFARVQHRRALLFTQLKYVTTNAMPSVPVAIDQPRWPVLLFLEGATGFRQMNTYQVENLVSNGYIVAAIDQPGAAATVVFPDGHQTVGLTLPQFHRMVRPSYMPAASDSLQAGLLSPNGSTLHDNSIIPYLAQDVSFALDRLAALDSVDPSGILTGKLDLQRVGAFGVSLGGIVVGETCRRDARVRACLALDAPMSTAVVAAGLRQPTMFITRDVASMRLEREQAGGWPESEIEAHQTTMHAVYERLTGAGYFIRVPGMFHSNFTDIPNWTPLARLFAIAGPINAMKAHAIVNAYSLAFFERHLVGRLSLLLDSGIKLSPDVQFESRRP